MEACVVDMASSVVTPSATRAGTCQREGRSIRARSGNQIQLSRLIDPEPQLMTALLPFPFPFDNDEPELDGKFRSASPRSLSPANPFRNRMKSHLAEHGMGSLRACQCQGMPPCALIHANVE